MLRPTWRLRGGANWSASAAPQIGDALYTNYRALGAMQRWRHFQTTALVPAFRELRANNIYAKKTHYPTYTSNPSCITSCVSTRLH